MSELTISASQKVGAAFTPNAHMDTTIERGEDFQRRVVEALTKTLTPTLPWIPPGGIHYLAAREASFLVKGCFVQAEIVTVTEPGKALVFWCVFSEGEQEPGTIWLVDWARGAKRPVQDIIAEVEGKEGLKRICVCFCNDAEKQANDGEMHLSKGCSAIDDEKVAAYVLEFLNYETARGDDGNPDDNEKADPGLLAHDREDTAVLATTLDWWPNNLRYETDLMHDAEKNLNSVLATNTLNVKDDTDYSRRVQACILAADVMVQRDYRVFTARNKALDSGLKGQIKKASDSENLLLRGLPPAYIKAGARLGLAALVPNPVGTDEWQSAGDLNTQDILETLSNALSVPATQLEVARRQRLDFYDLDLLELHRKSQASASQSEFSPPSSTYVLWKPGFVKVLDGTRGPIFEMNDYLKERQESSNGFLIQTEKQAVDYTRFFGRYVSADKGPFILLTSGKDKDLASLDLAGAALSPEYDSVGEVLGLIAYPEAKRTVTEEGEELYEVRAWVLYGTGIFKATFQVGKQGSIEMTDDDPVLSVNWGNLKPMTASKVESMLSKVELPDSVITGQLTSETLPIRVFRHCRFRGRVDLRNLVSARLSFEDCLFENGLDLSGARVEGSISLTGCVVRESAHYGADSAKAFCLEYVHAGQLQIASLSSDCSLAAQRMTIAGPVQVLDTKIRGNVDLDWLAAQLIWFYKTKVTEGFELTGCVVNQFINFDNVKTTDKGVILNGSIVENNYVSFRNVSLAGDLCANSLRVGTAFILDGDDAESHGPSWIGGSVGLIGAKLPELLRIRNTNVGKSINANRIVSGAFRVVGPNVRYQSDVATTASASSVGGMIDLTDAVITHDVTLVDVSAGGENIENSSLVLRNTKIAGNVNLFLAGTTAKSLGWLDRPDEDSNDNGQSVGIPSEAKELDPRLIDFSSSWTGGIDLGDSSIGGDVDLTSIKCPHGKIQLIDARIERNLTLRSNQNDLSRKRSETHKPDSRRVEATSLIMTSLECKGTTDITGVTLERKGTTDISRLSVPLNSRGAADVPVAGSQLGSPTADKDKGKVVAKLATFGKELNVSVRLTDADLSFISQVNDPTEAQAMADAIGSKAAQPSDAPRQPSGLLRWLPRSLARLADGLRHDGVNSDDQGIESALYDCLDLTGSTIGELTVSVNDQPRYSDSRRWRRFLQLLRGRKAKRDVKTGIIILQNAHVNRFTAILRKLHGRRLYPRPLDLSFAEIKWWKFDAPNNQPGEDYPGEDYIELLAGDDKVQRHIFRSIEQNLLNQGNEEGADEVHKEMQRRLRSQPLAWFFRDFWTDSGTSPNRLLVVVLGWFLLSASFFSIPGNIAPSAEGLSVLRSRQAAAMPKAPSASEWGYKDGLWIALRYHVPVAAFTAQHEWQPSNEARLIIPKWWPFTIPTWWPWEFSWSSEDYANIVLIAHWMLWPIILILFSRKHFRRIEK